MARIAFVQNLAYEYLSVMYLAAVLKQAGHEVEVFLLERSEKALISEVLEYRPDLVAFSCSTGVHHWAVKFAAMVKNRRSVLTIFGGPHATFFPELIEEPSVDIICRGEGEEAIVEIAEQLDAGKTRTDTLNCFFKLNGHIERNEIRPLIRDLDSIPNPDRSVYRSKYKYLRKTQAAFMAGRGCPFSCSFCFNHALRKLYEGRGRFVRYRKPERVVEEIENATALFNLRTIYMQDDTLILNREWLRTFSKLYRDRIGLPMLCLVRADQVDEDSIAALSHAGVINVFFGIESGDETLRNKLLMKGIKDCDILKTVELLRKNKIRFRTYNMVGLPGETLDQALKTLQMNAEIGTDFPWCAIFHPFPGTELGALAAHHDLLVQNQENAPPSFFRTSIIRLSNEKEIINLHRLFYYGVRFPSLIPLIKIAIRLPKNPLFDVLFLVGYAINLHGSENLNIRELASVGLRNVRQFFYGHSQ